jgi:hypothetical protein
MQYFLANHIVGGSQNERQPTVHQIQFLDLHFQFERKKGKIIVNHHSLVKGNFQNSLEKVNDCYWEFLMNKSSYIILIHSYIHLLARIL